MEAGAPLSDGPDELYDLVNDPGERDNRIDEPALQALRQAMQARLTHWFDCYVDPALVAAGRCAAAAAS